jgi:tetratricopeptide (TPR) repeat protein
MGDIRSKLLLDVDGLIVYIKMENGSKFMYPRIYRNGMKFENAVHNALNLKTQQYVSSFVIAHDREHLQSAEGSLERSRQRNRMIPNLMKKRLKEDPKDQRALFNLSNWYMSKHEFKLAVKYYKRCIKLTPSRDERYFLWSQVGIAHQFMGHNLRALFTFFDLEKLIPGRWETKRLIGGVYIAKGRYKKALPYFTFALEGNKCSYLYGLFGHDLGELWDLIASCYYALGEYAKAVIAWNEAIQNVTDEKRKGFYATKRSLVMMLSQDSKATLDQAQFLQMISSWKPQGVASVGTRQSDADAQVKKL